jgi:hypothetical protein
MMLKMGKISIESMLKEVGRIFATDLGSYDKKHKSARSTKDYAMAALSVFYFKWPSFLQYEIQKQFPHIQKNLESLFSIKEAPSDTQVRERLDVVDPICFRGAFKKVFAMLQRNKVLEEYAFMDNHYLISIDGTGQYSSDKVHCDNCCVKNHKNGDVSYYHHMLGACMVHPERNRVIPFAPEPILKQDGNNKNDCERNASKRLLSDLRREHPHLKIIIVEDALAANGPHLKTLKELDMKYIIGVKPGDHKFLFDWVAHSEKTEHEYVDKEGTKHKFSFVNTVPLNDANFDLEVNFIEYWEEDKKGKKQHFSWITDIPVTKQNVHQLMRGGRSRWRIESVPQAHREVPNCAKLYISSRGDEGRPFGIGF